MHMDHNQILVLQILFIAVRTFLKRDMLLKNIVTRTLGTTLERLSDV